MYVIIVYDIEQKRVAKVCKYLRRYLTWVQNSVFEGETTPARFKEIKIGLKKLSTKKSTLYYFINCRTKNFLIKRSWGRIKIRRIVLFSSDKFAQFKFIGLFSFSTFSVTFFKMGLKYGTNCFYYYWQ